MWKMDDMDEKNKDYFTIGKTLQTKNHKPVKKNTEN